MPKLCNLGFWTHKEDFRWTSTVRQIPHFYQRRLIVRRLYHQITPALYKIILSNAYYFGDFEYQTVVGFGRPIEFLCKAFVEAQTKWATIQKNLVLSFTESYAIFYCCKTTQSLIKDRNFTILSDHWNLLCLKGASNSVTVRWPIALSEIDFTLGFISGANNIIADSM